MSKYNLTDIYEQFKAGDKFSTDFDYDGMLKAGLEAGVDTDLNTLKALSDSFEDVNYHRENSYLQKAIDALENEEPIDEVSMLFGDFHAEIKQTMKELEMDIEPTLGKFMDTQMSSMMNEDEFDEARQAAIESSEEAAGIKEAREFAPINRKVSTRIEGLLDIGAKKKFLDAWEDLYYDLVDDEPFDLEDVVAYLSNEMGNAILGDPIIDDFEQEEFTAFSDEDSIEEAQYAPEVEDRIKMVRKVLSKTSKFSQMEINAYIKSLMGDFNRGEFEAFDDFKDEDYVEDMENFLADKALQEHFNRFK